MDDLVTRLLTWEERTYGPEGRQVRASEKTLREAAARITALEAALKLAANRLHRCSVDYDTGTRQFIEVGEWAEEARQALGAPHD